MSTTFIEAFLDLDGIRVRRDQCYAAMELDHMWVRNRTAYTRGTRRLIRHSGAGGDEDTSMVGALHFFIL
jgi:hypothetical protein